MLVAFSEMAVGAFCSEYGSKISHGFCLVWSPFVEVPGLAGSVVEVSGLAEPSVAVPSAALSDDATATEGAKSCTLDRS